MENNRKQFAKMLEGKVEGLISAIITPYVQYDTRPVEEIPISVQLTEEDPDTCRVFLGGSLLAVIHICYKCVDSCECTVVGVKIGVYLNKDDLGSMLAEQFCKDNSIWVMDFSEMPERLRTA